MSGDILYEIDRDEPRTDPVRPARIARNAQPCGAGHRFLQLVEKRASVLFPIPFGSSSSDK
jgi:hypothetical protein